MPGCKVYFTKQYGLSAQARMAHAAQEWTSARHKFAVCVSQEATQSFSLAEANINRV